MKLSKFGVWYIMDYLTAGEAASFAQKVESWGYSALWVPEAFGRNVLVHAAWLLANTKSLIVASGIANIYARDPLAMVGAQMALNEQFGGRFLLGIGVSHSEMVEGRGQTYRGKPLTFMRDYLSAMADVKYQAPPPSERPRTVIAALGPKMIELGKSAADGVHPFNITPEHTAEARAIAREHLAYPLALENYRNNWRRLGFDEADFAHGGSDRLIDALYAWGDDKMIRERIDQQLAAGADHVCLHPVSAESSGKPDERLLELLAPGI